MTPVLDAGDGEGPDISEMSVRVVHEGSWIHPGGAGRVAREMAKALDAPVTVGHTPHPEFWTREGLDVEFPFQDRFERGLSGRFYKADAVRPLAELRRGASYRELSFGEDLVITSGTAAKWFVPRYDQHHVHYCHVPPPRLYARPTGGILDWAATTATGIVDRWFADFCDGMIANSEFTRRRIEKHYGRPAEEIAVLHPPIETDRFSHMAPNEDRYVVMIGRLTRMKRVDVALKAFAGREDVDLVLVGDGPLREACEEVPGVSVYSGLSDFALEKLVARSVGGIAFAREEHCGMTPKEFQAAGKPVVVPDEPNLKNHVEDGETGVVVDPSVEGLGEGTDRLLSTGWDVGKIQAAAEGWSTDRFRDRVPKVLETVLNEQRVSTIQ